MDYISKNGENIEDYLKRHLSQKRLEHIYSVVREAEKLCDMYGGNKEKCRTAALFHDMAREMSIEQLDNLIDKYHLPENYKGQPNVSHGKIAEALMKDEWGIEDMEILNGVSYHTTGRENMSLTEKIVFIADAIEPHRDYQGVENLRKATYDDLDKGCYASLVNTVEHLKEKGVKYIDEDTIKAKKWFERKMHMNSKDFAILAAKTLDNKKGQDITIVDIATKSSIADYMVLASGGNERLIGALADEVEDEFAKEGMLVKSIEGKKESGWILMDFGDIIVNVLTLEMRDRYNIEKVWADCEIVNWEE